MATSQETGRRDRNVTASTLPWEQGEEEWEWVVGEGPVLKGAGSCKVEA